MDCQRQQQRTDQKRGIDHAEQAHVQIAPAFPNAANGVEADLNTVNAARGGPDRDESGNGGQGKGTRGAQIADDIVQKRFEDTRDDSLQRGQKIRLGKSRVGQKTQNQNDGGENGEDNIK